MINITIWKNLIFLRNYLLEAVVEEYQEKETLGRIICPGCGKIFAVTGFTLATANSKINICYLKSEN